MIQIVFPAGGEHDRDNDGLVDIEVTFRDTGSGIDSESLVIQFDRPLGPLGAGGMDALSALQVVERDSLHVILEETTTALLPNGQVGLSVQLSDRAGNLMTATTKFDLPAGSFHSFMESPVPGRLPIGIEMVPAGPTSEEPLGILLSDAEVIPFDPFSLEFGEPIDFSFFQSPVDGEWDPIVRRLFIVSNLDAALLPFDPINLSFEAFIPTSKRAIGISRGPSGKLYLASVARPASISIVDPILGREIAFLETTIVDPLNPEEAFIRTPRVPPGEDVMYVPLGVHPLGLLVVDANTGVVLRHLDLDPSSASMGFAVESTYDRSSGLLYLSELGRPGGLTVFDTNSEEVIARIVRDAVGGKFPTLSPSKKRVFLSLAATFPGQPENWFLDATTFQLLERIPVEGIGSSGSNASVFRPDGQLVFVASGNGVAVYLNRE